MATDATTNAPPENYDIGANAARQFGSLAPTTARRTLQPKRAPSAPAPPPVTATRRVTVRKGYLKDEIAPFSQIPNALWVSGLSAGAKVLWCVVRSYCFGKELQDRRSVDISMDLLTALTGGNDDEVRAWRDELVARGWLEFRSGGGRMKRKEGRAFYATTWYRILVPNMDTRRWRKTPSGIQVEIPDRRRCSPKKLAQLEQARVRKAERAAARRTSTRRRLAVLNSEGLAVLNSEGLPPVSRSESQSPSRSESQASLKRLSEDFRTPEENSVKTRLRRAPRPSRPAEPEEPRTEPIPPAPESIPVALRAQWATYPEAQRERYLRLWPADGAAPAALSEEDAQTKALWESLSRL